MTCGCHGNIDWQAKMAAAGDTREWVTLQRQLRPQPKAVVGGEAGEGLYQRHERRRQREALEEALKRGHIRQLDRDLVLASQLESEGASAPVELRDVRRISLSGSSVQTLDDIAILSCAFLRVCNLASCFLRDVSAFYGCSTLLKLDVSNNQVLQGRGKRGMRGDTDFTLPHNVMYFGFAQIGRLPSSDFWSSLHSLRVLYLNGNAVNSRGCLDSLNACPQLHILTLYDTPLVLVRNYRHHVVNR